jgi:hypothetical protein
MSSEPVDLDLIGGMLGTDKSSAANNYLIHYDRLFAHLRSADFNFIEIGIFKGASLATWRKYFNKATIIGVDVQESCRQYARDDIIVEIGSQDDPGFLFDLARRYPPKVIIDDGSHLAHHVIFTFETLFPMLEAGGIYVVEDLHFHVGSMGEYARGLSELNPLDYFAALSRMVMSRDLEPKKKWGFHGYCLQKIDDITSFKGGIAIRKAAAPTDQTERFDTIRRLAEQEGTADAWARASSFIFHNGNTPLAITAQQNAIRIHPTAQRYREIAWLYRSDGKLPAAIEAAEISAKMDADPQERGLCLEHLGDLLVGDSRRDEALRCFREAKDLVSHPVIQKRIEQKIQQNSERNA